MKKGKISHYWSHLLLFLSILGPGIITGSVDNDAGGITTYSVMGASYGYNLLWILFPSLFLLIIIQEMNARMGMVTGRGLADLIREHFGVKATFLIFCGLLLVDIGNTSAEFAGIAGSGEIFGVSKYIAVPLSAIFVWLLVVKGTYKITERIFLIFSAFLFCYVISALMAKPDWTVIGQHLVHPRFDLNQGSFQMVMGTIGTTIAPWMLFYMQSAVTEKGLSMKDYKYSIWDVIAGSFVTVIVAFFIVIACAASLHYGTTTPLHIEKASDAAAALRPLAGELAGVVFAFGLFIASFFSACILPVASSFYICEAFGFEAGINKSWHEAPAFYTLFTSMILIGVAVILIPGIPLIQFTVITQVLNGVLLPVILFCMLKLVNSEEVMGKYVNGRLTNVISNVTIYALAALSIVLLVYNLFKMI